MDAAQNSSETATAMQPSFFKKGLEFSSSFLSDCCFIENMCCSNAYILSYFPYFSNRIMKNISKEIFINTYCAFLFYRYI